MNKQTVVVALGGNAILSSEATAQAQQKTLQATAQQLVKFIKRDYELVVSHGNGPQVGNLLLQQAASDSQKNPAMPLDTCVAMTQGSIGYWLQIALNQALKEQNLKKEVATLITQVLVDPNDPAFHHPSKPIGPFYTEAEAKNLMSVSGVTYQEDAGRGWRKVVPSPKPLTIQEAPVIKQLVNAGVLTISAGGGGVPVIETPQGLTGCEAVIDKDFAAEKLAELVEADSIIFLTGVDHVAINFNTPSEEQLTAVTVSEMETYITQNQFAPGSMLPKVEAALAFVKACPTGKAIISSLENLENVMDHQSGTVIRWG